MLDMGFGSGGNTAVMHGGGGVDNLDDALEHLSDSVFAMPPHQRTSFCIALLARPERSLRKAGVQLLAAHGPQALTVDSARTLLEQLRAAATWGCRQSTLEALALHPPHTLAPLAPSVATLLAHADWPDRAVGLQALQLLDADGLLPVAPSLLQTMPTLDYSLQTAVADCLLTLPPAALAPYVQLAFNLHPHVAGRLLTSAACRAGADATPVAALLERLGGAHRVKPLMLVKHSPHSHTDTDETASVGSSASLRSSGSSASLGVERAAAVQAAWPWGLV